MTGAIAEKKSTVPMAVDEPGHLPASHGALVSAGPWMRRIKGGITSTSIDVLFTDGKPPMHRFTFACKVERTPATAKTTYRLHHQPLAIP
jgi:hypothetical protein